MRDRRRIIGSATGTGCILLIVLMIGIVPARGRGSSTVGIGAVENGPALRGEKSTPPVRVIALPLEGRRALLVGIPTTATTVTLERTAQALTIAGALSCRELAPEEILVACAIERAILEPRRAGYRNVVRRKPRLERGFRASGSESTWQ